MSEHVSTYAVEYPQIWDVRDIKSMLSFNEVAMSLETQLELLTANHNGLITKSRLIEITDAIAGMQGEQNA